jgi:hypothetical protein
MMMFPLKMLSGVKGFIGGILAQNAKIIQGEIKESL